MPKEIHFHEWAPDFEDPSAPTEIVVDQSTARRLEELCSKMTDTCGLIEAILQLAVSDESEKRVVYIKAALNLSARGTKSIKMFLAEWSVLVEESKSRENSWRSATPLAEAERCAVMNALRETGGDKEAASRLLRIGRRTLYRRLKEYNQSP